MRNIAQLRAIILKLKRGRKYISRMFSDSAYERAAGHAVVRSLRKNPRMRTVTGTENLIKSVQNILKDNPGTGFRKSAKYLSERDKLTDQFAGKVYHKFRRKRMNWDWPEE